ncbi:uncharacterized mitochondrial protein-like protein [Tanacetum coccineum]
MGSHTLQQLKRLSFDELKALFETTMIRVQTFHPIESEGDKTVPELTTGSSKRGAEVELDHEGSKKQKTNEASGSFQEQPEEEEIELSQEELQQMTMVVPVEEVYVEALQVKYPIIDWEIYSEDTRRYWRIIRVGNHTEAYQTFDDMLKKFDRSLVKERFSSTDPTDDKERTLWVELKRLFEPDTDDIMWKLHKYMHDPLTWSLYDTCGVHHVSTDIGHDIFMLVEKDYQLIRGLFTLMLCNKLQVDQYSEMADELLRKISKVVMEKQEDEDNTVIRNKARLVAKIDVKMVFLKGCVKEEVYDRQPDVFVDQDHPKRVYRLKKALYGLKQAPRAWYEELSKFLDSGFELTAFLDADHAGYLDTCKSTSGGIQFLGGKLVEKSFVEMYFVRTEYQLADMFTKALSKERIEYLFGRLGMRCLTLAELEVLANEYA